MIWSEVECHATGEHEIKEPQDESQKRVLQSSGDVVFQKQKPLMIFFYFLTSFYLDVKRSKPCLPAVRRRR
jgi:hypothetical protein